MPVDAPAHHETRHRNTSDEPFSVSAPAPLFPRRTLLEAGSLPLAELAELARCEGQSTRPIYRVHRWFARRLSTQFRALLAALTLEPGDESLFWERFEGRIPLDDAVVLDPFVGGGTTLVEASRCGARVVGFDIDPIAAAITQFELGARGRTSDLEAARGAVEPIAWQVLPFHCSMYEGRLVPVLHHFWVEVTRCSACGEAFELHPHYQLARDRQAGVQWAFCQHSHEVQELPLDRIELWASDGRRTRIQEGTLMRGKAVCPSCGHTRRLGEDNAARAPKWRLFAQEVLVRDASARLGYRREFKQASDYDRALSERAAEWLWEIEAEHGEVRPSRPIPEAPRFDRRPLIHGISRYDQLFNPRQLLHLTLLGRTIRETKDDGVREALALAFTEHLTTCCMYTAYAFDYRRTSPLFSLHGFRHVVRPVELNPWLDGIGRGTFLNALRKLDRAAAYAAAPTDGDPRAAIGPDDGNVATRPEAVLSGGAGAAICRGSSADLDGIPDESVHLVLTDPPYLDNVSYSELSDFYLAWRQQLGVEEGLYGDPTRSAPLAESLATTARDEAAVEAYRSELTTIFRSCHRVLRDDGLLVFTYHHKAAGAWAAIGGALAYAGFRVTRVVPMRGEGQGGLHSKAGTIKWDAVLVCRKQEPVPEGAPLYVSADDVTGAVEKSDWYGERLRKAAFRLPDRLNLTCALVAAAAQPQTSKSALTLLLEPALTRLS